MKRVLIGVLLFAVLAGLGLWFFGRPICHRHKEKRLVRMAQAFMQKAEYPKAWVAVRQIYQLNTNNVEACRILADLAELGRSPHAVVWRRRVAELAPTLD